MALALDSFDASKIASKINISNARNIPPNFFYESFFCHQLRVVQSWRRATSQVYLHQAPCIPVQERYCRVNGSCQPPGIFRLFSSLHVYDMHSMRRKFCTPSKTHSQRTQASDGQKICRILRFSGFSAQRKSPERFAPSRYAYHLRSIEDINRSRNTPMLLCSKKYSLISSSDTNL